MTSFAMVAGLAPLWIASGASALARRILGTAVIGGLLAATCIAIFVIPVAFYAVEALRSRYWKPRRPIAEDSGPPTENIGEEPA